MSIKIRKETEDLIRHKAARGGYESPEHFLEVAVFNYDEPESQQLGSPEEIEELRRKIIEARSSGAAIPAETVFEELFEQQRRIEHQLVG